MRKPVRLAAFGVCLVLVAIGIVCAAVLAGMLGAVLAFVFIATGLVFATSLAFLEVGMSEDRELARVDDAEATSPARARWIRGVRLHRMRSHRGRLG